MNSPQSYPSHLPEHDLELLSAYLDNQLSVAERVSLERRLAQEASLRAELAELRATTAALRELAPLRPPRSFTLDPATVRRPRAHLPLSWVLQLGSGMVGILLVLLATTQLLAGTPEATMAPMPAMVTSVPEAAMAPMTAMATPTPATMSDYASGSMPAPAAEMRMDATSAAAASAAAQPADPEPSGGTANANTPAQSQASAASADGSAPVAQATDAAEVSAAKQPNSSGLPPGLTLTLGLILLGGGIGWHLYSRRRAGVT